jgi:predicted membrane-bound mannosyltransferase
MKRNHSIYLNILMILSVIGGILVFPSTVRAALVIGGVSSNSISNGQENTITIFGNEFVAGSVVSLDGYGSLTTSSSSCTVLTAVVPASVPAGIYTLTVTNPDLSTTSLADALTIIQDTPTVTPSQTVEPSNNYERPVIVVDSYSLDQDTISPGNSFILFITLYNAGQLCSRLVI